MTVCFALINNLKWMLIRVLATIVTIQRYTMQTTDASLENGISTEAECYCQLQILMTAKETSTNSDTERRNEYLSNGQRNFICDSKPNEMPTHDTNKMDK